MFVFVCWQLFKKSFNTKSMIFTKENVSKLWTCWTLVFKLQNVFNVLNSSSFFFRKQTFISFFIFKMPKARKKPTSQRVKEEFICIVCGKSLSSSFNLRIHTDTNCSTSKNHSCEICDAKFLTSHSLKTHLNSLHFGDKKFVCSFCAKTFSSKGQLKVHERSHTKEKAFNCLVNKNFEVKLESSSEIITQIYLSGVWQRI